MRCCDVPCVIHCHKQIRFKSNTLICLWFEICYKLNQHSCMSYHKMLFNPNIYCSLWYLLLWVQAMSQPALLSPKHQLLSSMSEQSCLWLPVEFPSLCWPLVWALAKLFRKVSGLIAFWLIMNRRKMWFFFIHCDRSVEAFCSQLQLEERVDQSRNQWGQ